MWFQFFENAWDVKKSKCENHVKSGPIICKMMRGVQIWPQNSNRITFDPFLGQKLSNLEIFLEIFWFSRDFDSFFGQKGGSNIIPFELCGQIWNPLIILHTSIIGTHLKWFSHFDFLTSHAFSKIWNRMRGPFFSRILKFWKAHRYQRQKRHRKSNTRHASSKID